jgi:hypothetical protein
MKKIIFTAIAIFGLATITMAQVPNYVPTNGLVGWWPFNGNANDESGNGNNGTVTGATLTTDRFLNSNAAYTCSAITDKISLFSGFTNLTNNRTISLWFNSNPTSQEQKILSYRPSCLGGSENFFEFNLLANTNTIQYYHGNGGILTANYNSNAWNNVILTINNSSANLYINGILAGNIPSVAAMNQSGIFGLSAVNTCISNFGLNKQFTGTADDIGLWNRALTLQEITDLYNGLNCSNNLTISPASNQLQTGSAATFNAATSDPNPSYVWQSDFGQGFQTLNNFGNYTGTNTGTLNIANVQLPNHTQPIRVISTSGNCIDTSNVAIINILDTCITNVTVYDTLLTTVTDTLVINATITGLNPPNNLNTIKVFPNPANDHITINYGNFASMSGYTLKITNNLGQVVFTTTINQQTSYIDLSTWTGNGIYFVQLIDPQNNTVENRKIVIQ